MAAFCRRRQLTEGATRQDDGPPPGGTGSGSRRNAGFTLLELLIVMFLVTLLAGVTAVSLTAALPSSRLAASARDVATSVKKARTLARTTGKRQVLTINLESGSYQIAGSASKTLPPGVNVMVDDPLDGEVTRGTYTFSFSRTGSTDGGSVVLWNEAKRSVVSIDPIAGAVVIK